MERSRNHVERGLSKLRSINRTPDVQAWLSAYLQRIQELEDAAWEVLTLRALGTAEGVQLDAIGRLVGRGRNGLSDAHYRLAIAAQIRINRSHGKTVDLVAVAVLSVPAGTSVTFRESAIATFRIIVGLGDYDLNTLMANLRAAKPQGVRLILEITADNNFRFSPTYDTATVDPDHSWGPDGGVWSFSVEVI